MDEPKFKVGDLVTDSLPDVIHNTPGVVASVITETIHRYIIEYKDSTGKVFAVSQALEKNVHFARGSAPSSDSAPWTCERCGQLNSGWATNCGRCERSQSDSGS
jgi:hypothetical protein